MSNKSRQDKSKTPAQAAAPPPTSNDIIPGRFTEADWHRMVEQEDGEDFVLDIVHEIVESTLAVIYDKYIASQTLPYTIQATKDLLLQIIEWQFLACDLGEENPSCDSTWLQEDEPVTPVTDSWAQGSVPFLPRPSSSSSSTSLKSDRESEMSSVIEERPVAPEPPFEPLEVSATPLSISSPAQLPPTTTESKENKQQEEALKSKSQGKKKTRAPFKPHKGKLPSFSGVDLSPVTDDKLEDQLQENDRHDPVNTTGLTMLSSSTSILKRKKESSRFGSYPWSSLTNSSRSWSDSQPSNSKAQHGRPPGIKDVLYDERGNVIAVMKISPEKLPSHRVRTKFSVVNDESEVQAIRARAKTKKLGLSSQNTDFTAKDWKHSKSRNQRYDAEINPVNHSHVIEDNVPITPLPPPLVDTMDISAGVVVREGKVVRRGPRQLSRRVEKTPSTAYLQPLDSTRPTGQVRSDLLTRSSPIIRPLRATEPIPPITSQSSTYT
ncbi:uncharacterized protein C2orf81 homolog [Acropora millepora]|uniref:uncharacterized protein C2orf81 homolog n=1 Tax=Acropora millepora TaxID=45264 RepID=UPI001CF2415F|nr:uncharacterized protein C2orf81 homolog [Acropora millepora]